MTEDSLETSVPDWIIDHPETMAVFQELGIDHSCDGKSLAFVYQEQGLREQNVLSNLHEAINGGIQTASPLSHR